MGFSIVTWVGRGALVLAPLSFVAAFNGGSILGALISVFMVWLPIAGLCAALKAWMLERQVKALQARLAVEGEVQGW